MSGDQQIRLVGIVEIGFQKGGAPAEAIDAFTELARRNPGEARFYAAGMLYSASAKELEAAWPAALEHMNSREGTILIEAMLGAMAQQDPLLAAEHLESLEPGKRPRGCLEVCARQLAAQAPQAVADWLAKRSPREREIAGHAVAHGFLESFSASRNHQVLMANLAPMPSAVRRYAIQRASVVTARETPQDSLDRWLEVLPRLDEETANDLRPLLFKEHAKQGGAKLVGSLQPSSLRNEEIAALATGYAHVDPAGAFEWARDLQAGPSRVRAVEGVVSLWLASEPFNASRLVHGLEPGPARDGGLHKLVDYASRQGDSASARLWANEVSDPQLRASLLERLTDKSADE